MSSEILVNIGPRETRAALVESGVVQEVYIQRASRHGLVSNIYKGLVKRVLPGMQAAFVDIGLERTAFLHASDMLTTPHLDTGGAAPQKDTSPPIDQLLSENQEVLVQIVKDPLGSKS